MAHSIRGVATAVAVAWSVLLAAFPVAALAIVPCDQNQPPILFAYTGQGNSTTFVAEEHHKYIDVAVFALIGDDDSPPMTLEVVSATSSEADDGLGRGDKPNDIVLLDPAIATDGSRVFHFLLRAEVGKGTDSRTYSITLRATDGCGASAESTALIVVQSQRAA
jgi:hypothetical protein